MILEEFSFWAFKLAKKGVNIKFFNSSVFEKIKESHDWGSFSIQYEKYFKEFLNTYNEDLYKSLKYLVEADQLQYCKLRYGDDENALEEAFNSTLKINEEVKKLIDDYGYFSEEKIGLNIKNDTILNRLPIYWALSRHNFQANGELFFSEFISEMVGQGILKKDIAELVEQTPMTNNIFCINGKFYIDKFSEKNKKTDLNLKKLKFVKKNEDLKFLIFPSFTGLSFKNDKNRDEFIDEDLILIDL